MLNANREEMKDLRRENITNCRPPPNLSYILDANGEVIRIIENMVPKTRSPLKSPRIHGSIDREGIDQEKECLLDTVLNHRPHQSHHHNLPITLNRKIYIRNTSSGHQNKHKTYIMHLKIIFSKHDLFC